MVQYAAVYPRSVQLAARDVKFLWPAERILNAALIVRLCGLEWETYQLLLEITDFQNNKKFSSSFWMATATCHRPQTGNRKTMDNEIRRARKIFMNSEIGPRA